MKRCSLLLLAALTLAACAPTATTSTQPPVTAPTPAPMPTALLITPSPLVTVQRGENTLTVLPKSGSAVVVRLRRGDSYAAWLGGEVGSALQSGLSLSYAPEGGGFVVEVNSGVAPLNWQAVVTYKP